MSHFYLQHTLTTDTEICVRTYDSNGNNKDAITVDYLVIGGKPIKASVRYQKNSFRTVLKYSCLGQPNIEKNDRKVKASFICQAIKRSETWLSVNLTLILLYAQGRNIGDFYELMFDITIVTSF